MRKESESIELFFESPFSEKAFCNTCANKSLDFRKEDTEVIKIERARQVAIMIIEEFEELLNLEGIKIPSNEREGREEEANIYGTKYYDLEDKITEILNQYMLILDC